MKTFYNAIDEFNNKLTLKIKILEEYSQIFHQNRSRLF